MREKKEKNENKKGKIINYHGNFFVPFISPHFYKVAPANLLFSVFVRSSFLYNSSNFRRFAIRYYSFIVNVLFDFRRVRGRGRVGWGGEGKKERKKKKQKTRGEG